MSKCSKCYHKKVCIDGANYKTARNCKNYVPVADVQEVKHGHWEIGYFHDRVCSCCAHPSNDLSDYPYNYCPWCGAKMDGLSNENDKR